MTSTSTSTPLVPSTRPATARVYSATRNVAFEVPASNRVEYRGQHKSDFFPPLGCLEPALLCKKLSEIRGGAKGQIFSMIDGISSAHQSNVTKSKAGKKDVKSKPNNPKRSSRGNSALQKKLEFVPNKLEPFFSTSQVIKNAPQREQFSANPLTKKSQKLDLSTINEEEDLVQLDSNRVASILGDLFKQEGRNKVSFKHGIGHEGRSGNHVSVVNINDNDQLMEQEDHLIQIQVETPLVTRAIPRRSLHHETGSKLDELNMENAFANLAIRDMFYAGNLKNKIRPIDYISSDQVNGPYPVFELPTNQTHNPINPKFTDSVAANNPVPPQKTDVQLIKERIQKDIEARKKQAALDGHPKTIYRVYKENTASELIGGEALSKKLYRVEKITGVVE